jgi:methylmalonyl-CoA/ethylmalonyl-CoA epimerase
MTRARELRFAFTVEDLPAALQLFRDVFALETIEEFEAGAGRGVILRVPAATLELFDAEYTGSVDEIEVGRRLGETVRIAVRVEDLAAAAGAVAGTGAEAMAEPVVTPWRDHNQRFRTKSGMQLTLFQPSSAE